MFRFLVIPFLLMSAACAPVPHVETATRAKVVESALPPMKSFEHGRPQRLAMSNADLVRDFLDLSFQLESGRGSANVPTDVYY